MSMLVMEQKKGRHFIKKGERVTDVNIILKGEVTLKTANDEFTLEQGSVIGLLESAYGKYICDYITKENTLLVTYAFENAEDFKAIFEEQPLYVHAFLHVAVLQCKRLLERYKELQANTRETYLFMMKQYREYKLLCKQMGLDARRFVKAPQIVPVAVEKTISHWEVDYMEALSEQPQSLMKQFYMAKQELAIGEILSASKLMNKLIVNMETMRDYLDEKVKVILEDGERDLFGLWFDLSRRAVCGGIDVMPVQKKVREAQTFLLERHLLPANVVLAEFQKYWKFDFEEYAKQKENEKSGEEASEGVSKEALKSKETLNAKETSNAKEASNAKDVLNSKEASNAKDVLNSKEALNAKDVLNSKEALKSKEGLSEAKDKAGAENESRAETGIKAKTKAETKDQETREDGKQEESLPENMDYFEYIISYAEFEDERKGEIHELMNNYREAVETQAKGSEIQMLYQQVGDVFYEIYEKAFFKSMDQEDVSPIMQIFFQFGFLDPDLVKEEYFNALFSFNDYIAYHESTHVYTFYEWLKRILNGEKETSKNEFDLDYAASLREMRKANRITAEEEKMYQLDRTKMVHFELENMFRSGSRGTYGRGGMFTPVLSNQEIVKPLEGMFVSVAKLEAAIENVCKIDFRCFYRQMLSYDPKRESSKMYLQKEVLPDIILMPLVGKQSMMWQENVGPDRESPGRFLFPIFSVNDVNDLMLDTIARYRWEICRKMQGMRWNDITEKSLTSEYFDYLQYYKKNKELSQSAKEKVGTALKRAKGSLCEVFAADYTNWLRFESQGNSRINKVARDILSRYCPFPMDTRLKLLDNPMFRTVFSKFEASVIEEETKFKNTLKKFKDDGGEITQEMMDTLHFYQK